jgi:hypothetical protein
MPCGRLIAAFREIYRVRVLVVYHSLAMKTMVQMSTIQWRVQILRKHDMLLPLAPIEWASGFVAK